MSNLENSSYPVERTPENDGWVVKAHVHTKTFLDKDYGYSVQNSFVEANNHAEDKVLIKLRRTAVERNCTFVDKTNRKGITERYIRITRPLGGYKFFKLENSTGIEGKYLQSEYDQAIQLACKWFMDERLKCQEVITSRNIERKKDRKKTRHSFLFGDPMLGLRQLHGK